MLKNGFKVIEARSLQIAIGLYFALLLVLAPFIFPFSDSFYYWYWGQHLSLSYLDGPPMIAYLMGFSTVWFGNNFFAINMVAVICAIGTVYFLVRMGRLIDSKEAGWLAAFLWLVCPMVTHNTFLRVTYDSPECLFWVVSIYYMLAYVKHRRNASLYGLGLAMGLALLSKYSAVILGLGLIASFAVIRQLWPVLRNKHFYGALLLMLVTFSPVLIWNAEHGWPSFRFLLDLHLSSGVVALSEHIYNVQLFFWRFFTGFNIWLFIIVADLVLTAGYLWRSLERRVLLMIMVVFILFWSVVSYSAFVTTNYYLPLSGVLALLVADSLVRHEWRRLFWFMGSIFTIISVILLFLGIGTLTNYFSTNVSNRYAGFVLEKQAISQYRQNNEPIISLSWNTSSRLIFLAQHIPGLQVHIPSQACSQWQAGTFRYLNALSAPDATKQGLYLAIMKSDYGLACVQQSFNTCRALPPLTQSFIQPWTHIQIDSTVYAYQCSDS